MSMPSSRLLVATTAGSRPDFSSSSMIGALLLGHRAVVGAREHGGAPRAAPDWAITWAGLRVSRRRGARHPAPERCRPVGRLDAFVADLVEPGGEPLGEPAASWRTRWSSGALARGRRCAPRRAARSRRRGSWPAAAPLRSPVGWPSSAMSGTGTTTLSSTLLVGGGCTTSTGRPPPRKRATSSTGRTVADRPMRCAGRSRRRVEPLEREREVGAALGAGDGVHLVDDHRLDAAQRLAGRRGEQQEQRLGRGDQDVGRARGRRRGARRPGCRRSASDLDVGLGQRRAARPRAGCRPAGARRLRSTSTASAFSGET